MNKRMSMTDVAFDLMNKKKKPIVFSKLWEEVNQIMGFSASQSEQKIAIFYTNLSLDTRFVKLQENKWDLRNRHSFNEVHIATEELLINDDDYDSELDLKNEDKEDGFDSSFGDFGEDEEYTNKNMA